MSTVPPPNLALPQMLAAAAANTATIPRPSPDIANLAPGSTLTGTIITTPSADPKLALLATATGDVPLRLPAPLPQGTELTIEVVRATPAQVTVRLVALDGQPLHQPKPGTTPEPPQTPQPAGRLPAAPGTPAPLPQGAAWWPGGPQPVTTLPQISAYVIAGPQPAPTPAGTPTSAPAPTPQASPASAPTPQPPAPANTAPTPPAPQQQTPQPVSPAPPPAQPLPGTAPAPQAPTPVSQQPTPPPANTTPVPQQQTPQAASPAPPPAQQAPLPAPAPTPPTSSAPPASVQPLPGTLAPGTPTPGTPAPPPAPVVTPALAPTGSDVTLRIVSIVLPQGDAARPAPPQPNTLPFAGLSPGVATPASPFNASQVFGPSGPQAIATPPVMTPAMTRAGSTPTASPAPGAVPNQPPTSPAAPQMNPQPTAAPSTPLPGPQAGTAAPSLTVPPPTPLTNATPVPGAAPLPGGVPMTASNIALPNPPTLVLPNRDGWPAPTPLPPATVTPSPPQATLTGTVIFAQNGIPVVQTAEGQIQLNIRANLPVGTMVTLDIIDQQAPTTSVRTPAPPVPAPALLPLVTTTSGWPTLTEAVQLLQRADPAAATQLSNAIPDGGPRSALAVMSLVQALRTGESRQWPGDASLRALERASPRGAHLARQLSAEVGELSRQVRETGTEWRALPLPWQGEGRIERIRLVMRDVDGDEHSGRKGGGGTRFLVDLDLSHLGPLQLDGMFRKETRGFDMMIRTRAALPDAMRQDLAEIFANSNAAMNLVGTLSFQVVKKFPDPLAGPAGLADKSGVWA